VAANVVCIAFDVAVLIASDVIVVAEVVIVAVLVVG